MPNCDFYATSDDHLVVLDFVFSQPGWIAVELASVPEHDLREFHSTAEVVDAFSLEAEDVLLQLYSPEMKGGGVRRQRIDFKKGAVPGATYRYDSRGWGLIQLYLHTVREGRLSPSHTNCNSESRATAWSDTYSDELGPVDAWDWAAVAHMSRRLNRHIRKVAVAKSGRRAVLPGAHAAQQAGAVELALN